jgi:hypothetical protein
VNAPPTLQLLMMLPAVGAAQVGNVGVVSIAQAITVAHVDRLYNALAPHRDRWGRHYMSMTIIRERAPLPDDAVRKRVAAIFSAADAAQASVAIIDADGFWAAAARGVFAGLALVSRRAPHATRSIDEGLRWAHARLGADAPDVRPLGPLLERFRNDHRALAAQP